MPSEKGRERAKGVQGGKAAKFHDLNLQKSVPFS